MTKKQRTCLACGRPLTGRQRKWCKDPRCHGWESLHPRVTITCECGQSFETYKGYHTRCPACEYALLPPRIPQICIECGMSFNSSDATASGGPIAALWCEKKCHDRYFQRNPPPDYFTEDWILFRNNLCFRCGKPLIHVQERGSNGFCSAECHAVYNAREKFREREQERRILEEKGPEQAKAFAYARWSQWSSLHPHYSEFYRTASPEYLKEYGRAYSIEYSRMKTRTRLGLPEDAPLPDKIPHTTELPIKLWLEENNIVFEIQKYIEVGGTFTLVDFFIPMTGSDTGICLYCDGDYWHGPEFPERQEGDKRQTKELEKLGYVVFRLWESDIERGIRPVEILELVKP